MNVIWIIAKNTYREIIRNRILYGLIIFAILLIGLSLALGQLSFAEQTRITANFGFTAIHLSAAILSIFVGSTLVAREIEKKTITTLLVRPVSRTQFIIGKSMGLMGVIAVSVGLLTLVLGALLMLMKMPISATFFIGLYGILLEAAILLSLTIFFGCFSSPMLAVSFSIGIFLIGHWLESLQFFADKSDSALFVWSYKAMRMCIPNLELFNWRSLFVYDDPIPVLQLITSTIYGVAWFTFITTAAAFLIRRRDLG
jgi:Cu-processing system permease protein